MDEYNLEEANRQLQETISFCELKGAELGKLLSRIRAGLGKNNISLDYLDSN